ncbi:hypothetical protein F66182_7609 [Fusarium sp. NRRL 66182]|nr:hypothetical protein F66182_7609 [Fusarium sp. NRRL 66182]
MIHPWPPKRRRKQLSRPTCTHLTMTRVYDPMSRCSKCNESGPFGWLYQCTQDCNEIIEEKLPCMDYLDFCFKKEFGVHKGSTEGRHYKLTPEQIATLPKQQEGINNVITSDEECRYMSCPGCRPSCADRAFLSLDAVANGEIPPTAANGFGFESLGGRPVIDKDVVKGIDEHRKRHQDASHDNRRMMQILDDQIARFIGADRNQHFQTELENTIFTPKLPRQLPTVTNVAAAKRRASQEALALSNTTQRVDREAWGFRAPDRLGSPWPWVARFESPLLIDPFQAENQELPLRQTPRASRIPWPTGSGSRRRRLTDRLLGSASSFLPERYPWRLPETKPSIPFNDSQDAGSQRTGSEKSKIESPSTPLAVDHGVALTEESIETRVPDVMTQV